MDARVSHMDKDILWRLTEWVCGKRRQKAMYIVPVYTANLIISRLWNSLESAHEDLYPTKVSTPIDYTDRRPNHMLGVGSSVVPRL